MRSDDSAAAAARAAAENHWGGVGAAHVVDCTPPWLSGRVRRARFVVVADRYWLWRVDAQVCLEDVMDYAFPDYFDLGVLTADQLAGALEERVAIRDRDRAAWLNDHVAADIPVRLFPQDLDVREQRARLIALGLAGAAAPSQERASLALGATSGQSAGPVLPRSAA